VWLAGTLNTEANWVLDGLPFAEWFFFLLTATEKSE
jgi:hypothetical protein